MKDAIKIFLLIYIVNTSCDRKTLTDLLIKQKHNKKEHTYCARCRKKIPEGKGYPRLVGRKEPTSEERQKKIDFILLFRIFCEECNKYLDEKKN